MAKIRNVVLVFLTSLVCCTESLIPAGFDYVDGSTVPWCHITDKNYARTCDGITDCSGGVDENACEKVAVLFYYTYEEEFFNCDTMTYPVTNYLLCSANNSGYRYLNVSAIYLNNRKRFSVVVLNETSGAERMVPQKGLSLKNVQIYPRGFEFDVYYSEYLREVRASPWYHIFKRSVTIKTITDDDDPSFYITQFNDHKEMTYMYHTKMKYIGLTRDNFRSDSSTLALRKENSFKMTRFTSKNLAFDLVTSNVYAILQSQIKVCEKSFSVCITLPSKFIETPVLLTISQEHRLLFWMEQKSPTQFQIYKYPLDNMSKATCIVRNIKSPRWLTIDRLKDRVYWMDAGDNDALFIYSATFSGSNIEVTSPGTPISNSTSVFEVFDENIYWPDSEQRKIWTCPAVRCDQPVVYINHPQHSDAKNISKDKFLINGLKIDYHPKSVNKIKNACNTSICSHLCVLNEATTIKCYCGFSNYPVPDKKNNGYCEDNTLLVAYHNDLFTVGFLDDDSKPPIVHKIEMNITSISTLAYNSEAGNVLLAEIGQRNIYSWVPRTRELQSLVQDGAGTIKCMKYDAAANNLYWVDPVTRTIKVMNLDNRIKINLIAGNSSYVPIDLALVVTHGHMIVLFIRNNSSVVMEQISMDGSSETRKILHQDEEVEDVGHLSLHFMDSLGFIFVLDKQMNKIKYFLRNKLTDRFQDALADGEPGKIESLTSLDESLIWAEDNLIIRRGMFDDDVAASVKKAQNISLGLKMRNDSVLSMTSVSRPSLTSSSFLNINPVKLCNFDNGGCSGLCLTSDTGTRSKCTCAEGEILLNGTSCQKVSKTTSRAGSKFVGFNTSPGPGDRTSTKTRQSASKNTETPQRGSRALGIILVLLLVSLFGLMVARGNFLELVNNFWIRFRPNVFGLG